MSFEKLTYTLTHDEEIKAATRGDITYNLLVSMPESFSFAKLTTPSAILYLTKLFNARFKHRVLGRNDLSDNQTYNINFCPAADVDMEARIFERKIYDPEFLDPTNNKPFFYFFSNNIHWWLRAAVKTSNGVVVDILFNSLPDDKDGPDINASLSVLGNNQHGANCGTVCAYNAALLSSYLESLGRLPTVAELSPDRLSDFARAQKRRNPSILLSGEFKSDNAPNSIRQMLISAQKEIYGNVWEKFSLFMRNKVTNFFNMVADWLDKSIYTMTAAEFIRGYTGSTRDLPPIPADDGHPAREAGAASTTVPELDKIHSTHVEGVTRRRERTGGLHIS
jgi:hypothetical protein